MLEYVKKIITIFRLRRKRVIIHPTCFIGMNNEYEGCNKIYKHCSFNGKIGFGSYIGKNSNISANIGKFSSIAPNVIINRGRHPFKAPYATTSPMFYSIRKQNGFTFCKEQSFDEYAAPVEIGNDCWIGQNVFIIGGVKIDDGAVVLAGSVVTKDVPAYSIVGGVPAKVIKYRYTEDVISRLKEIQWWNKDEKWLSEKWYLMNNIDLLLQDFKI